MANTFTNVNDTKILVQGVEALKKGLTRLEAFTLDVGSSPAEKNQTIYVPLATARTAEAFNTTYEDGNTTIASQSVDVNTHAKCSWHISETQNAQSPVELFEMSAVESGYGLASYVQNAVFNIVTDANFGNTANTDERVVTAANFDVDEISEIRKICTKTLGWRDQTPGSLGVGIMDGAYISTLLKDPALRDRSASGKDTLVSGMVGKVNGFDIMENNTIVSSTPGSTQNLVGMFAQKASIAVAIRPIQPLGGAALEFEGIATDPDTGISMSYRRWVNTSNGKMWGTFTVLMGVGKVDEARLLKIVSA